MPSRNFLQKVWCAFRSSFDCLHFFPDYRGMANLKRPEAVQQRACRVLASRASRRNAEERHDHHHSSALLSDEQGSAMLRTRSNSMATDLVASATGTGHQKGIPLPWGQGLRFHFFLSREHSTGTGTTSASLSSTQLPQPLKDSTIHFRKDESNGVVCAIDRLQTSSRTAGRRWLGSRESSHLRLTCTPGTITCRCEPHAVHEFMAPQLQATISRAMCG